ncbi:MAG: type II secretion system F family protein [Patescibacteria group bacterium]|nr:type II secretion system F family protein [Patescibacteria group bacterium]MDW8279736.1 type II secretion system F family protein [bacterium]
MKFRYQARTKEGELQVGFVEAGSRDSAEKILLSHNLFILLLEEVEKPNFFTRLLDFFNRVKLKDLVIYYRQMSVLFESQIPLNRILETLYNQTSNPNLKEATYEVLEDIQKGLSFSQAAEKQKSVFSEFAISMIRSGEVTGNLDKVISFLADYTEREFSLISKAKSAAVYPVVIIGVFIIVSGIMVTMVFPQIKPIFDQSGVKLPFFANLLLGLSAILTDWWFVIVIFLIIFTLLLIDFIQTDEGKALFDELKLRLPLLRKVFLPILMSRFANASALLIKGGVPVAQAMEIVSNTINNIIYQDLFKKIANEVKAGMNLSEAIIEFGNYYFPELVPQMISVGETTGQLDKMFERIANFYAREADNIVSNLAELIQPILIIGIGILVALLFASILVPIYNLTSVIS